MSYTIHVGILDISLKAITRYFTISNKKYALLHFASDSIGHFHL